MASPTVPRTRRTIPPRQRRFLAFGRSGPDRVCYTLEFPVPLPQSLRLPDPSRLHDLCWGTPEEEALERFDALAAMDRVEEEHDYHSPEGRD